MISKKKLKALTLMWQNLFDNQQKNNEILSEQNKILYDKCCGLETKLENIWLIPQENYFELYEYYFFTDKENKEWNISKFEDGYFIEFWNWEDFEIEERANDEHFYVFKTIKQVQKFIFKRLV